MTRRSMTSLLTSMRSDDGRRVGLRDVAKAISLQGIGIYISRQRRVESKELATHSTSNNARSATKTLFVVWLASRPNTGGMRRKLLHSTLRHSRKGVLQRCVDIPMLSRRGGSAAAFEALIFVHLAVEDERLRREELPKRSCK